MTATTTAPTSTGGRRHGAGKAVALVAAGLVLVALAVGRPSPDRGDELDPAGTGPFGAKALVLLLEELGADVDIVDGPPPTDADTAVLLRDVLAGDDVDGTLDWVDDGGVLLAANPFTDLVDGIRQTPCPEALAGVDTIRPDDIAGSISAADDAPGTCLGDFVRVAERGDGDIVAVSEPDPFLNEGLGDADNAVLAAAILAPSPGTHVAFIDGPSPGVSQAVDSLADLVPSSTRQSLLQGFVALGVWVAWRARRLGRPIVEAQPVAVAGSELVVAVGRLLDARRQPSEAAELLRADTRRLVAARVGLAGDVHPRALAAAVASRTTLDQDRAAAALGERAVATDDDLLAVAADLDRIRSDVLGSQRP